MKAVEHRIRLSILVERSATTLPKAPKNGMGGKQEGKPHSYFAFRWVEEPEKEADWEPNTAGDLQMIVGKDLAESNPTLYGHLADNLGEVPTISPQPEVPPCGTATATRLQTTRRSWSSEKRSTWSPFRW